MSSGVVVCGTKRGINVRPTTCCVAVDVKDYAALSDRVLEILKDPASQRKVTQSAQQWADTHSIHWTVDRVCAAFQYKI